MTQCWSLTQRFSQRVCWAAVKDIMTLILQVHNSCKRPVTVPVTSSLWVKRSTFVVCRSKPHCQRPVQSNIQNIKPERPICQTPEPCDAVSFLQRVGHGMRHWGNFLNIWLLFGLWFIVELRFYCSAAGTVLTEWAVAVQKVDTRKRVLYGDGGG